MGYHYWLLYRLPELPDPMAPPANQLVAPVGEYDSLLSHDFLFMTEILLLLISQSDLSLISECFDIYKLSLFFK